MHRTLRTLGLGLLSASLLLSACGTAEPETIVPTATETAASPTPQPAETEGVSPLPTPGPDSLLATPESTEPSDGEMTETAWSADGIISEGEYSSEADFDDIRLWWHHDDTFLYVAMEGDTTGWVAVGLDPDNGMQGASYLFGFVDDGEAMLWDAYGTAPTGPNHPPDEDLGGTDDIVAFTGVEEAGITRFEAQIPLDSGDPYDKALEPGETYPIIVAIGGEDDFNAYHQRYDSGELVLR